MTPLPARSRNLAWRPGRQLGRLLLLMALFGLFGLFCCRPAAAVLVFVKGREQPLVGFLVSENAAQVVLKAESANGNWLTREIPRREIEDLLYTVSPERLATLAPAEPQRYRDYAEELAEKRIDPEAKAMAARLYVIAAHLAPEKLGRSCLLGLLRLEEEPTQQRRIRAMLYQIDPAHDPRYLSDTAAASTVTDPAAREELADTLRLLRQGKLQLARGALARPSVAAAVGQFGPQLRYGELVTASQPVDRCPTCDSGSVPCATCAGKGTLRRGFRSLDCPSCRGTGKLICPACEGDFTDPPLRPDLLRRVLTAELSLRRPASGADAEDATPIADAPWSRVIAQEDDKPEPHLSLLTLTEFDPRQSVYRAGEWVAP